MSVVRSNRTQVDRLCVVNNEPDAHAGTLSYSGLMLSLLLAGALATRTADAQQMPPPGATVSDEALLSASETNPPATKPVKSGDANKASPTTDVAESPSGSVAVPSTESDALSVTPTSWPVATSLKATLRAWAQRQGWPEPQFLTQADWAVEVPGSIPGTIEDALKELAEGFGKSSIRPRIEISANHVMLVSEIGSE